MDPMKSIDPDENVRLIFDDQTRDTAAQFRLFIGCSTHPAKPHWRPFQPCRSLVFPISGHTYIHIHRVVVTIKKMDIRMKRNQIQLI